MDYDEHTRSDPILNPQLASSIGALPKGPTACLFYWGLSASHAGLVCEKENEFKHCCMLIPNDIYEKNLHCPC